MENVGLLAGIGTLPGEFLDAAHLQGYRVICISVIPGTDPELKEKADVYYEINAFILDLPTTAELGEVFQNDKLNSTIMTREEYKKRSVWRRFVGWFAHLFTPVI